MINDQSLYATKDSDDNQVKVEISGYAEKKSTLSTYTVYTIKGSDSIGSFEYQKRYSDFDHLRESFIDRWPGCFIPPLPIKKVIGKSDLSFVEERRRGLEYFLIEVGNLKHLWYSKEFYAFLRAEGDTQKNLKKLSQESHDDIISKYDQIFPKLNGKTQDTIVLGRVLDFGNYVKKILPVITNFKQMALSFIEAKNANAQQLSILLNYVLPQYEKSCLSIYCNQITQGKFIFNEIKDEKLARLIKQMKQLLIQLNFEELYFNLEREQREIESFIQTYKGLSKYEDKFKSLKNQQKQLELQLVKLNNGKQGFFASFSGNLESNKAKNAKQLQNVRHDIKSYEYLIDLLYLLLGHFQVLRFRKQKLKLYFGTMKKIAQFQIKFTNVRSKICEHVLQNHNLLQI